MRFRCINYLTNSIRQFAHFCFLIFLSMCPADYEDSCVWRFLPLSVDSALDCWFRYKNGRYPFTHSVSIAKSRKIGICVLFAGGYSIRKVLKHRTEHYLFFIKYRWWINIFNRKHEFQFSSDHMKFLVVRIILRYVWEKIWF